MSANSNARFGDLERRFSRLESSLNDTPEKEAISILHAMIHETRRQNFGPDGHGESKQPTFEDIANLYHSAPGMEGQAENDGLPVGTPAPGFRLPDAEGKLVSLADFRGMNVVLAFYPLDWSPACSDQLSLYQSELQEFARANTQVIGVSVDSLYSHGAWAAVRGITFPLLADFNPKGEVASRYRVWRQSDGFSERALYVIDSEGIIRYSHVSSELHHVPDIYELFEQLNALETTGGKR
jgi:peroxiredoxin